MCAGSLMQTMDPFSECVSSFLTFSTLLSRPALDVFMVACC
uniref:Uncharacterized protein n=1 Tax=Anguilla anguilla TaxID=7936 RepID=A0A0E9SL64_ANGAN